MHAELLANGFDASRKRVARIMADLEQPARTVIGVAGVFQ